MAGPDPDRLPPHRTASPQRPR